MMNNDLYKIMLEQLKREIETEMIKELLTNYVCTIEYLGSVKNEMIREKQYRVKYEPKNKSLFGQLPSFQKSFRMEII